MRFRELYSVNGQIQTVHIIIDFYTVLQLGSLFSLLNTAFWKTVIFRFDLYSHKRQKSFALTIVRG